MKKATLNTIASVISSIDFEGKDAVIAEINAELNRGADARARNIELYEAVKPIVMAELSEPCTISELYEAVKDKLPAGFSKGKLQYAITQLWTSELIKTEGKVNTYAKA